MLDIPIPSPIGTLYATVADGKILRLSAERSADSANDRVSPVDLLLADRLKTALDGYFRGEVREFDFPLAPAGTDFQRAVWSEMQKIPYGETLTYGMLAQKIGKPKASRAVGQACHVNPILILIPCHRVVSSTGLGGFGLGLDTKMHLLRLEGVRFSPPPG